MGYSPRKDCEYDATASKAVAHMLSMMRRKVLLSLFAYTCYCCYRGRAGYSQGQGGTSVHASTQKAVMAMAQQAERPNAKRRRMTLLLIHPLSSCDVSRARHGQRSASSCVVSRERYGQGKVSACHVSRARPKQGSACK